MKLKAFRDNSKLPIVVLMLFFTIFVVSGLDKTDRKVKEDENVARYEFLKVQGDYNKSIYELSPEKLEELRTKRDKLNSKSLKIREKQAQYMKAKQSMSDMTVPDYRSYYDIDQEENDA